MQDATLTYGLVFLGLCLAGHFFIRARLPDADPYLYPLAALLAAFGLVMIYRINAEFAREQAQLVRGRAGGVLRARSSSCATTTRSSAIATRSPRRESRCW